MQPLIATYQRSLYGYEWQLDFIAAKIIDHKKGGAL